MSSLFGKLILDGFNLKNPSDQSLNIKKTRVKSDGDETDLLCGVEGSLLGEALGDRVALGVGILQQLYVLHSLLNQLLRPEGRHKGDFCTNTDGKTSEVSRDSCQGAV